jgi:hypothetical protein
MKTKLNTLSAGLLSLVCVSCTSYQHFTMSSNLQLKPDYSFGAEHETASVNYQFSEGGQLRIAVFNNSSELIYIDWEKSSLILGEESILFPQNESYFQGTGQNNVNEINFEGILFNNPNRRYIPPKAYISESINLNFVDAIDLDNLVKSPTNTRYFRFTREDTPVAFDCYLYINSVDGNQPSTMHHEFWASELRITTEDNVPMNLNEFSKREVNDAGAGMGILLLGGAVIYLASTVDWEEVE